MSIRRAGRHTMVAAVLAACMLSAVSPAVAEPAAAPNVVTTSATAPGGSHIAKVTAIDARNVRLHIRSASMNSIVVVDVLRPADTSVPRPALYLLNGAGGGEDAASWQRMTDALDFLGDKNINVVQIVGGAWTFYADWKNADPVLGVNKWKTFLTEELPPLVDAALGTNGVNAIAGLSMSGVPVLNAAISKPGLFRSAAVYSGLAQTSDPVGQQMVKLTVETWGGGDTENMWGPADDPLWKENDPILHAEQLRGTELFVSTGSGIPGVYDAPGGEFRLEKPEDTPQTVAIGAVIEAGVNWSTQNLERRLDELDIPATFVYRDSGTHSWGYWQDDLKASWPVLEKGLNSQP